MDARQFAKIAPTITWDTFTKGTKIGTPRGIEPMAGALDPWQRTDFEGLIPGAERVMGRRKDGCLRAMLTRARGHSKTSDIGALTLFMVGFSTRILTGIVAAVDEDQAKLFLAAIERLVRAAGDSLSFIEVQRNRVVNTITGSSLTVISSDVASSWGHLCDFVVADEWSVWPKRDLFDSLFSTAAKKPCLFIACGNAWFMDSWQARITETVQATPDRWYYSHLPGCVASWISADDLAEQKRLLPPAKYAREWENIPAPGSGDAITAEDFDAARNPALAFQLGAEKEWVYGMGCDLGLTRDAGAVAIVAKHRREALYRVARIWRFVPPKGGKVDLDSVKNTIAEAHARFKFKGGLVDPYQAELLVSQCQKSGIKLETLPFTVDNIDRMARLLCSTFVDRCLEFPPHEIFERELKSTRIIERTNGKLRLEFPRDAANHSHGDTVIAVLLAMLDAANAKTSAFKVYVGGASDKPEYEPDAITLRNVSDVRRIARNYL